MFLGRCLVGLNILGCLPFSENFKTLQPVLNGAMIYATERFFPLLNYFFSQFCFPTHKLHRGFLTAGGEGILAA